MATDLTGLAGRIYLDVSMTAEKDRDLSTPSDVLAYRPSLDFTFGVGDDMVNQIFHDQFTIAAAGTQTIDLVTDLNPFGIALGFDIIKAIIIRNVSTTTAIVDVGGGTFDGYTAAANVESLNPDGIMVHVAPDATAWAVTAASNDEILITGDAALEAIVDVIILGVVTP